MDAKAKPIREILFSDVQYLVPFFQRDYAWSRSNWERLKDDIWQLIDDTASRKHFLGPLVCAPMHPMPGESSRFQLIDGQQRLTTLSLLLLAMRDVAIEFDQQELTAEIGENYLMHRFKKGLDRYKLLPRSGDRETFQALVDSKSEKVDKSRNIFTAYEYFYKLVRNHCHEDAGKLRELFSLVVSRLYLVVISLDEEDPYEIFESLNSTGLPLEESDLIRNYLFMQIPLTDQEDFQEEHWKPYEAQFTPTDTGFFIKPTAFYRDFLRRNGKYVSAKHVFAEFKNYYDQNCQNPLQAVAELTEYVQYEKAIGLGKHGESKVSQQLGIFNQLDAATATPVLFNLMHRNKIGTLSNDDLAGCIQSLNSFILRRSICGESSRGYANWFCELAEQLGDSPVIQLNSYLLHRGWPDDETLIRNLIEFPIYSRENAKCRLILQELEKAFGHKEKVDLSTLQIEHVMPQTLAKSANDNCWFTMLGPDAKAIHKRYLHTLGNLTLTGYNPKLSNRPFTEKVAELKSSNLSINKEIVGVSKWNEQQILSRGKDLAQRVAQIWVRPKTDIAYVPVKIARDEVFKAGRERRTEYWKRLAGMLKETNSPWSLARPCDGTYAELYMPVSDVQAFVQYLIPKSQMVVQLRFFRERGRQIFETFHRDKDIIERNLSVTVIWTGGSQPIITAVKEGVSLKDPLDWLEQHEWIVQTLNSFYGAFYQRAMDLHDLIKEKSESKQLLLDFWLGFHRYLRESGNLMLHTAAYSSTSCDFPSGRSSFWYVCIANPTAKRLSVSLNMGRLVSRIAWPILESQKNDIEQEVSEPLIWNNPDDLKHWHIKLVRPNTDISVKENWTECYTWLSDNVMKFDKVFRGRIANMRIADDELNESRSELRE